MTTSTATSAAATGTAHEKRNISLVMSRVRSACVALRRAACGGVLQCKTVRTNLCLCEPIYVYVLFFASIINSANDCSLHEDVMHADERGTHSASINKTLTFGLIISHALLCLRYEKYE